VTHFELDRAASSVLKKYLRTILKTPENLYFYDYANEQADQGTNEPAERLSVGIPTGIWERPRGFERL
jgi:hypothetical protein